jgi:hypothetical protein
LTNGTYEELEHISNRIFRIQPAFNNDENARSFLPVLQLWIKKIMEPHIKALNQQKVIFSFLGLEKSGNWTSG